MLYLQYDFLWVVLDQSYDRNGGAEALKGVAVMPHYPAQAEVRTKQRRHRLRLVGMEWFRKMCKQLRKTNRKDGKEVCNRVSGVLWLKKFILCCCCCCCSSFFQMLTFSECCGNQPQNSRPKIWLVLLQQQQCRELQLGNTSNI